MEQNRKSLYRVLINNSLLTYTGTKFSEDQIFITIIDKFGNKISFNKSTIQSVEELN